MVGFSSDVDIDGANDDDDDGGDNDAGDNDECGECNEREQFAVWL